MDHKRSAAIRGGLIQSDVTVVKVGGGASGRRHGEVLHVARVMTFRVLETMLLIGGIEVRPGALEIGRLAAGSLVNMKGVLAGRETLNAQADVHTFAGGGDGRRADGLTFAVDQLDGFAVGGVHRYGTNQQRRHEEDFHNRDSLRLLPTLRYQLTWPELRPVSVNGELSASVA
jgi:hypothetical protein